jgi:hypothetical protein
MSTLTATQLQQQYIAYFGRPGDPAGIKYWLSSSSGISSAREFADKIYAQDEYKTSTVGSKSTEQQVNQLYQNLFGREADAAGLLYWTGEIEKGNLALSNVAYDLIWAASNPVDGNDAQATSDATALTNKVDAATAFTAEVEASTTAILAYQPESTSPWKSGAAFNEAVTFITTATATNAPTAADVTASVTTVTTASNSTSGANFTLTNTDNQTTGGADNLTGGTGDDTFLATSSNSFDNGDVIDGGAGTDTLTARYALSADKTVLGSVTNVEKLIVDVDDGAATTTNTLTIGVDGFTGLTDVIAKNADSSSSNEDTILFNNIAAGVNLGITNGDADSDVDFVFKTTTAADDTATLKLNAAKADEVTIAGIETLTITGESGESVIDTMVTAAATKYVMNGSGKVTLSDVANTVVTVDASTSTGGVVLAGIGSVDATITGGSGADTVDMASSLTTVDIIDLGGGIDRIKVGADETTALPNVSNVEEVEVQALEQSTGATLTVSGKAISSATEFVVDVTADANNAAVTVTFSDLDDNDTISIEQSGGDSTAGGVSVTGTLTADTTADDITLSLEGIGAVTANATNDTGVSTVTLDSHETISILANKNSTGAVKTNGINALAAAAATSITITSTGGEIDINGITNTTKLTSIDASGSTANVNFDGIDASKLVYKAGSGTNIISLAGLNNEDQLIGGSATGDYVTATGVTGLTAITGKLNIQDFETVELNATGANTIDASLLSGVTTLSVSGATPGTQTITGLASGVAVSIGDDGAVFDNDADVDITLADETGDADSLTVKINNKASALFDGNILTDSTIETVVLDVLDTSEAANNMAVTMTNSDAATITLKGGFAGQNLALGTLSTKTLTVDATDLDSELVFTAGAVGTGMTVTAAAGQDLTNLTLSAKDDTLTVASTGAVTVDYDGGAGTDTLNLNVKAGFVDTDEIDNFENLNFIVNAGDDITLGVDATAGANGADAFAAATTVTITGGNSLSTFEVGDADATASDNISTAVDVDATGFEGNVYLEFAADVFTATTDVDAGAIGTDTVFAIFDTDATDIVLPLTGVETFLADIDSGNTSSTEQYNFDVDTATGLKTVGFSTGTSGSLLDIDDYVSTVTVQLGLDGGTGGASGTGIFENSSEVDINLKTTSGTADEVNISLFDTDDQAGTIDIDAAGVEIVNISVSTDAESHKLNVAGITATSGSKVTFNITGGVSTDGIEFTNMSSTTDTIAASAFLGTVTMTDRNSAAMTITTGAGVDTLRMENASDVIDAGGGADTLNVAKELILGGMNVDLTSTTDQITTFNGSSNAGIQKGFRHVDLTEVTGSFGAEITANASGSNITGTKNKDQITLGTDATKQDNIHFNNGLESAANKNDTYDIVSNFTAGSSKDQIDLDISELETASSVVSGTTLNFVALDGANTNAIEITAGTTFVLEPVTGDDSNADGANATMYILDAGSNTYATADAAVDALELGGDFSINHNANLSVGDAFLFAYENSSSGVTLAAAFLNAADANGDVGRKAIATGTLDGIDLITFDDITDVTTFDATNFDLV